jgi:hypothetical protein
MKLLKLRCRPLIDDCRTQRLMIHGIEELKLLANQVENPTLMARHPVEVLLLVVWIHR